MEAPYTKHSLCNSSFSPNQKLQPISPCRWTRSAFSGIFNGAFYMRKTVRPRTLRITSDIAAWRSSTFLQSSEHYYSTFMVPGWKKTYPHLPVTYIFGTRGLVTSYMIYWLAWELGSKYIGNWKIRDRYGHTFDGSYIRGGIYAWDV